MPTLKTKKYIINTKEDFVAPYFIGGDFGNQPVGTTKTYKAGTIVNAIEAGDSMVVNTAGAIVNGVKTGNKHIVTFPDSYDITSVAKLVNNSEQGGDNGIKADAGNASTIFTPKNIVIGLVVLLAIGILVKTRK